MDKYFVISSVENLENHYAIKQIETNDNLNLNSKEILFDIDGVRLLYFGKEEELSHRFEKVDFFLKKFKSKLNKNIYKVDLMTALGRLAYGNKVIFLDKSITENELFKAVNIEKIRQEKFTSHTEITGNSRLKILKKYEAIEKKWLSYWKDSRTRLTAFYEKHPLPQEKNYLRSGLSSLLFGNFDKSTYDEDRSSQYKKFEWLCTKIAVEAEELPIDFSYECPQECGEKIDYLINFEHEKERMVYLDEDFPHGIYKRLYDIRGTCPECGFFLIPFPEDEYTCIFRNYVPEIIHYTIKGLIKNSIAYAIELKLYGVKK